MAWYNTTFMENTSGPLVMIQGVNQNTGSWFFGSFLIFLWMILLVWFKRTGTQDAFLSSSFIVSLIAGVGLGIEVLNVWQIVFPVSMLVASIVMKVWGES